MLLSLAALALVGAGCGSDDDDGATGTAAATGAAETQAEAPAGELTAPEVSDDLDAKPEIGPTSGEPPAELITEDIVVGKGRKAKPGDTVRVDYVGVLYDGGEQFDASWDRGQPFEFQLGAGMVIAGWDEGIAGMREGGRRLLIIPPDMGYGAQGAPPAIPPNATLVFVADLKKVRG